MEHAQALIKSFYHCLLQENRKSMIELQTSVKQDDTTRTRTPKPGYLNLSNKRVSTPVFYSALKMLSSA
jgi:hypothetical protein